MLSNEVASFATLTKLNLYLLLLVLHTADRGPAGVFRSREEGEGPDRVAAAGLGPGAQPVTLLVFFLLLLLTRDSGFKSDIEKKPLTG